MRRFLIGLIAGGIAYVIIPSIVVFWIVFPAVWATMHVISPGTCPHCGKGVRLGYEVCHHCGRSINEPVNP